MNLYTNSHSSCVYGLIAFYGERVAGLILSLLALGYAVLRRTDGEFRMVELSGGLHVVGHGNCILVSDRVEGQMVIARLRRELNSKERFGQQEDKKI